MNKVIRLRLTKHSSDGTSEQGYLIVRGKKLYITSNRLNASVFPHSHSDESLREMMVNALNTKNNTLFARNIFYLITHVVEL